MSSCFKRLPVQKGLVMTCSSGCYITLCVVSNENVSTVYNHIQTFSVCTILPRERRDLCLDVCCVEKPLAEETGLSQGVKLTISHGEQEIDFVYQQPQAQKVNVRFRNQ